MTVYFDPDKERWRYDFWRNGQRYFGYCLRPEGVPAASRSEAEDCETLVKARVIRTPQQVQATPGAYSLAQAIAAYSTEACTWPSWPSIRRYLEELLAHFGAGKPLAEITRAEIVAYRTWAAQQPIVDWVGGPRRREALARRAGNKPLWKPRLDTGGNPVLRDPATVNRYLITLSAVFDLAHNTPDPRDPERLRLLQIKPEVPLFEEVEHVPRPFPVRAVPALLQDLPSHAVETLIVAALTAWRQTAVFRAKASDLDQELIGFWYVNRKGKREGFLQLGPEAFAFFKALADRAVQVGVDRLILYFDRKTKTWRPIASISTSWRKALRRHGLNGKVKFHQLKTMVLSALHEHQVQPKLLQEIGQHRDFETTERHYIGVSDPAKRSAALTLERHLANAGIDIATIAGKIRRDTAEANAAARAINATRTDSASSPTPQSHTRARSGTKS